jgi:predicted transcriptional regulator YheO
MVMSTLKRSGCSSHAMSRRSVPRLEGIITSGTRGDPRALTADEKREILRQLADEGELERRGAPERVAAVFGISRSNVYYYLKKGQKPGSKPPSETKARVSVAKRRRAGAR